MVRPAPVSDFSFRLAARVHAHIAAKMGMMGSMGVMTRTSALTLNSPTEPDWRLWEVARVRNGPDRGTQRCWGVFRYCIQYAQTNNQSMPPLKTLLPSLLVLCCVLWRVDAAEPAPPPTPNGLPEANQAYLRENYTKFEYTIPMRDGVKLFTAVFVPKDNSKPYPILLT